MVQLTSLLFTMLAVGLPALGFKVPIGQPEGFYMVNYDDAGNEVHTPLNFTDTDNAPPPTVSVKPSRLVKRAVNWPSGTTPVCENTAWFAKSDFYPKGTAWDKFFDLCWHYRNRKIWQSTGEGVTAIYQDHGSAIAFECDYTGNPCSQVEWNEAVNWVAGTCAQSSTHMKPGYLNIPKWGKSYGYVAKTNFFCTKG